MSRTNIQLVQALDKLRLNNLYVHNEELSGLRFTTDRLSSRRVYLVETLAVINALVDRGTMLLYGSHGGGKTTLAKYLGQLLFKLSKKEIETCILRGHPQLTEEKILGTLDIAQLTGAKPLNKDGEVDVKWHSFVEKDWKIIDELNRLTPYAQNILLSLLAESSVKYHNESKRINPFTLFATMNPIDEANNPIALPLMDRFALALPITMPDFESLSTIGKVKDKSTKEEELPGYLKGFDLQTIREEVERVKYSEETELFIDVIISSYKLCDRATKEGDEEINLRELCSNCHWKVLGKVCSNIVHPLSVRVKEDLYRYGKALAWFLGDDEVQVKHIEILAPYIIWHRSDLIKDFKKDTIKESVAAEKYLINTKITATKKIIAKIADEFQGLKVLLKDFNRVKEGKASLEEFENVLKQFSNPNYSFLVIKHKQNGLQRVLEEEYKPVYLDIKEYNNKIDSTESLDVLHTLKSELSFRYDIPNRQFLAEKIEVKRRKNAIGSLPDETFNISYDPNFLDRLLEECKDLYFILKARYANEFKPSLNLEEVISDIGESDIQLSMRRVNKRNGEGFELKFRYIGQKETSIYKFLKEANVVQL